MNAVTPSSAGLNPILDLHMLPMSIICCPTSYEVLLTRNDAAFQPPWRQQYCWSGEAITRIGQRIPWKDAMETRAVTLLTDGSDALRKAVSGQRPMDAAIEMIRCLNSPFVHIVRSPDGTAKVIIMDRPTNVWCDWSGGAIDRGGNGYFFLATHV